MRAFGGLLALGVAAGSLTTLDLFVASKCPDAARCELSFLPDVLGVVGELVDLRLGFIAEPNASEPLGFTCMHGAPECVGNLVQLCAQAQKALTAHTRERDGWKAEADRTQLEARKIKDRLEEMAYKVNGLAAGAL